MDFFNAVTVERARELTLEKFKDFTFQTEKVDILNANRRILSKDLYSSINVPEFNRSTVDGYAIKVNDSHGANDSIPSILNIVGQVEMGEYTDLEVNSGEAISVPTGGMIPEGADGVIMIENTEKMDEHTLLIQKAISKGENIIFKGDDIKKGNIALKKKKALNPEDIGVMAALGIKSLEVYKKPKFFIISTGDEIIDIHEELSIGKIRDINSYTLKSSIENINCEVVGKSIVKDNYSILKDEVNRALGISDILLISGGSSVGTRDYTYNVINSFDDSEVFVHGISIKPGKPTIIGKIKNKLVVGLPGHPVSSIVIFKALVEYFIYKKLNVEKIIPSILAKVDYNFASSPGKKTYQMVNIKKHEDEYHISPSFGKSGMISLLSNSNGYIIIDEYEEGINKGETRKVYLL
ncbi:molybdopterin molybdotransferase MoeA [Senegalia massiliensis]|uniref:molybdopterin molybdotransferase MoeA n=1 Tax=Senegalia massiliensis TaxID=1720316 RepID=UPI00103258F5|nr:molybdopterin molybdotransferase MoeA [Senegalia massiliensis]